MANPYVYGGLAAFKIWAGLQQGSIIRAQGQIQSRIGKMNAQFAEYEAMEAERYGYTVAARYKAKENAVLGQQKAVFEAQGVDTTGTTAQELDQETRTTAFLNTLDVQKAARARALGLKVQASNFRLGADNAELQAKIDATGVQRDAIIGGVGSISGYLLTSEGS